MKRLYSFFAGICLLSAVFSQEKVVWGTRVVDVSSEFSPYQYAALQALYRPNVPEPGGESPNSWRPKSTDKEEFIMVAFSHPIKARQVAISENENPGAVKAVYAYDEDYIEYTLFEIEPRALPITSRFLNLFFEETPYEIHALKIVLECSINEGYNAIDAIGLSSSNVPINVLINMATGINRNINAEKLGENVNSEYEEHSPIISPDGNRLYFSRQFHPDNIGGTKDPEDIWVSELDEETQEWLPAKNIGAPLNTKGPNFISSISVIDGQETFILGNVYGKKGKMYMGVSLSVRKGDTFTAPVPLVMENEYNYSPNADFFLVPGGKAIILSAERDDSYGGRDLYVSILKSDSIWSSPRNLGSTINTAGEEESPFMAKDGATLYYSSDGFKGYGGTDIYATFKLDESWRKWSTPENLGPGINKEGDDEYFSIPSGGQSLYFTRSQEAEDSDIFSFSAGDLFAKDETEVPLSVSVVHLVEEHKRLMQVTLSGQILDGATQSPVSGAKISVARLPEGLILADTTTDENGTYFITLQKNVLYTLTTEQEGYTPQQEKLDFTHLDGGDTIQKSISIQPVVAQVEKPILEDIVFPLNKWELQEASLATLNEIAALLSANETWKIIITGYTDTSGSEEVNLTISNLRAKSAADFLTKNGIDKERISVKALGEASPKYPNDTRENRAKNRRVAFEIDE